MQRVLRKSSPASDNQISQASLPTWAGALFSCRLSSFWQSAGLQNHRPLVRIRPPSLREGYYKTETPVPGSDTGVLGGRGWIRTTEAEKQQIYSLSPLATREHAQILFTSVAGRLVYFIRLRAICQLLFSDFCSFSAEAVGRVSFGSDVSGARNPARRQWLRRTWGRGQ